MDIKFQEENSELILESEYDLLKTISHSKNRQTNYEVLVPSVMSKSFLLIKKNTYSESKRSVKEDSYPAFFIINEESVL